MFLSCSLAIWLVIVKKNYLQKHALNFKRSQLKLPFQMYDGVASIDQLCRMNTADTFFSRNQLIQMSHIF